MILVSFGFWDFYLSGLVIRFTIGTEAVVGGRRVVVVDVGIVVSVVDDVLDDLRRLFDDFHRLVVALLVGDVDAVHLVIGHFEKLSTISGTKLKHFFSFNFFCFSFEPKTPPRLVVVVVYTCFQSLPGVVFPKGWYGFLFIRRNFLSLAAGGDGESRIQTKLFEEAGVENERNVGRAGE